MAKYLSVSIFQPSQIMDGSFQIKIFLIITNTSAQSLNNKYLKN